jgi:hypothetical protein
VIAVGISGSREYPRLDLVRLRVRYRVELHGRGNVLFVHGAARGVDRTADEAARELGAATRPLPGSNADWARLGALAGHVRNVRLIQDEGIGALDGFWNLHSSGTADAVELALAAGLPVCLWGPRGERVEPERCIDWLDRHRPKRQRPTAGSVA